MAVALTRYELRIAIIYAIVWFIDLLDASILNVALPSIAHAFGMSAPDAEWAIIGFLLALTIAIPVSSRMGDAWGVKKVFLGAQIVYTASSLACGAALSLQQLIMFRIIQGAAGGLLIPVGMTILMLSIPAIKWSTVTPRINMVTLIAPAMGPLVAGYIIDILSWRWLFFIKLPLLVACAVLSYLWVQEEKTKKGMQAFDWAGFVLLTMSLSALFMGLSEVGRGHLSSATIAGLCGASIILGAAFLWVETKAQHPLILLEIFRYRLFTVGNIIQSAANMIFLGATFITGLYLQQGLGLDIVTTGWILAAITPGMLCALALVSRFYNTHGPLVLIMPGLVLMGLSMFGLTFVTAATSPFIIAFLIFCEGLASAMIQTPNVMAIFAPIPSSLKSDGSSIYALGKQLSATMGVALSTMTLSVTMNWYGVGDLAMAIPGQAAALFYPSFYVLALVPLLALPLCLIYENKAALNFAKKEDHLESETELGAE